MREERHIGPRFADESWAARIGRHAVTWLWQVKRTKQETLTPRESRCKLLK
jgi:hypothetical protein